MSLVASTFAIVASIAIGQPNTALTITEPGVYRVSDLYRHADKVAVVKVLAGDTESYDSAIYKGKVVRALKGVTEGQIVYFGPYLGTELGSEYVLFLKNDATHLKPKRADGGYGDIAYSRVFNEGYSSMLTSYQCVFDASSAEKACDYAVRICTDYIKVPDSIRMFSREGSDAPFDCRWARRDAFVDLLDGIAGR